MATKNLTPRNDNEGQLGTGAKKWTAVNAYQLYGKLQVQDYTTITATETSDLIPIYDQSNSEPRAISVGDLNLGGIETLDIRPYELSLDDADTACDRGTSFGIYPDIDFPNTANGAVWYGFSFPDSWSTDTDINLELVYTLNGDDISKVVSMVTEAWLVSPGDQPDVAAPNVTGSDNILTDSNNIGKYAEVALTNGSIAAANIPSGVSSVVLKLIRDVSNDTYTGELRLLSLRIISQ